MHHLRFTGDAGPRPLHHLRFTGDPKGRHPKIAKSLDCTPAQAAIKWVYDTGAITIPKCSNPGRIDENLASLNVDLSGTESAFNQLEEAYVSGWNPTAEP